LLPVQARQDIEGHKHQVPGGCKEKKFIRDLFRKEKRPTVTGIPEVAVIFYGVDQHIAAACKILKSHDIVS